jgi:uncharacterized protein (DUF2237 family)
MAPPVLLKSTEASSLRLISLDLLKENAADV